MTSSDRAVLSPVEQALAQALARALVKEVHEKTMSPAACQRHGLNDARSGGALNEYIPAIDDSRRSG